MREWLKTLRGDRSTADIAKLLGISQQYYSYIENGERQKRMNIQLCERISEVFGVSVMQIIEYEKQNGE